VLTVLLVDDDQMINNMFNRILGRSGYRAIVYPDTAPVLEEVDFEEIDLVVTDLSMPTPGQALIRTLRDRGIAVPIIVINGHISRDDVKGLKTMGANTVLLKPVLFDDLNGALSSLLPTC